MHSRTRADNFIDVEDEEIRGAPDAAAALTAMSTIVVEAGDLKSLCGNITDVAIRLVDADCASIQTKVPSKPELQLIAARGFVPESAAHWQRVHAGSSTSCGQALSRRERIIIPDVEREDLLAGTEDLRHLRLCGIRAVQSTPLFSGSGEPVGMLSTHWRHEYHPSPDELRFIDALAPSLAALIERACALEALRASEAALRLRVGALEQADQEKNNFLAMLAHELRNPLAPIRSVGEVLAHMLKEQPAARRPLAILRRQTDQLTRLVDDLLDISRIEQGRMKLEERPLEVMEILDQAIETVQPLIREKQHRLTVERLPTRVSVLGDRARLVQCVGNLLHNAAKYTDQGGEIGIAVRASDTRVSIEVRDNGAGIAPAVLPQIFDLFVQSEDTLRDSRGGLGIGLAIVKRLVEMHGGSVEAASPGEGRGSTFKIHLWRLESPQAVPAAGMDANLPHGTSAAAHSLCVLVVDANADAADTVAAILKATGHRVEVAYSALSALATGERLRPDAILLDLDLPKMSGYEVARRLRAQASPGAPRLTLVALSSRDADEAATRSAGFDLHLRKPVDVEALERALLGRRTGNRR